MTIWPPFEELPGIGEEPASFCWSPRMSYLGTAVTLSPEHYEQSRRAIAVCKRIAEYRDLPLGSILELEAIQKMVGEALR